jgi:hypothetical protein
MWVWRSNSASQAQQVKQAERGGLGAQQEFMLHDPLVPFRKLRVATALAFLDGFDRIKEAQADVQVPVFLAHPTEDKVLLLHLSLCRHVTFSVNQSKFPLFLYLPFFSCKTVCSIFNQHLTCVLSLPSPGGFENQDCQDAIDLEN